MPDVVRYIMRCISRCACRPENKRINVDLSGVLLRASVERLIAKTIITVETAYVHDTVMCVCNVCNCVDRSQLPDSFSQSAT